MDAGVKFPIHPLDTNFKVSDLGATLPGPNQCVGIYQPVSFDSTFGTGTTNFAGISSVRLGNNN